jgi:hypothetical protein
MPIHPPVPRTHSCLPEARASPLRLPEVLGVGGRGSIKCATSCRQGRAIQDSGVADQVADQVADRVEDREADPAVGEDSVAGEDLGVARREECLPWREGAEGIGREAGRE